LGPTTPSVPARARVWQEPQLVMKSSLAVSSECAMPFSVEEAAPSSLIVIATMATTIAARTTNMATPDFFKARGYY
jgi:hypothetical protein